MDVLVDDNLHPWSAWMPEQHCPPTYHAAVATAMLRHHSQCSAAADLLAGMHPGRLLEVNHSPSLSTDTPLDLAIKERVLTDVMASVAGRAGNALFTMTLGTPAAQQQQWAASEMGSRCPSSNVTQFAPPFGLRHAWPQALVGLSNERMAAEVAEQRAAWRARRPGGLSAPRSPPPVAPSSPSSPSSLSAGRLPPSPVLALAAPAEQAEVAVQAQAAWEERQRVHEDAHLGGFERVMPAPDPATHALHEELLHEAREVFYAQTTQGRLARKIEQLRERRAAEARAAEERAAAQERRVAELKAWMAEECRRHREERQRSEEAEVAQQRQQQRQQQQQQEWEQAGGLSTAAGCSGPADTDQPSHFAAAAQDLLRMVPARVKPPPQHAALEFSPRQGLPCERARRSQAPPPAPCLSISGSSAFSPASPACSSGGGGGSSAPMLSPALQTQLRRPASGSHRPMFAWPCQGSAGGMPSSDVGSGRGSASLSNPMQRAAALVQGLHRQQELLQRSCTDSANCGSQAEEAAVDWKEAAPDALIHSVLHPRRFTPVRLPASIINGSALNAARLITSSTSPAVGQDRTGGSVKATSSSVAALAATRQAMMAKPGLGGLWQQQHMVWPASAAASKQQLQQAVERQAVRSVAALLADVLKDSHL